MGCGLRKIRQTEDGSPGKIFSTLKRPQVETKTGVSYTYCHLDFLIGKEDGTSTLCLSSVRELPSQLQDLYQQGFVLTAVHPFVHACGPEPASSQRQLYRAVLSKLPESSEKSQSEFEPYHLKLEECLSSDHVPTPEHIQGYVKKQIQDAADQGIMFAGFVQEPAGLHPRLALRGGGREASLSLHSSPSSLRGSELTASPSHLGESGAEDWLGEAETEEPQTSGEPGGDTLSDGTSTISKSDPQEDTPSPIHNGAKEANDKATRLAKSKSGAELFGLFNYPNGNQRPLKYYTVKVPLRVQPGKDSSCTIEAHWLDHMTQHFNNGASLVDGYFHLSKDDDQLPKVIDGVFIFQEGDSNVSTAYDAIVVEQWTVFNGVQVKTDYIPLLQSLASFGWKLTCVLATPIVKTNSDGSVSTKQIVFLQRPALPLKKRQSKKLIFKTRNKTGKNSVKDALRTKKKKGVTEKELDEKNRDGPVTERKESTSEKVVDQEMADTEEDGQEVEVEVDGKQERQPDTEDVEERLDNVSEQKVNSEEDKATEVDDISPANQE